MAGNRVPGALPTRSNRVAVRGRTAASAHPVCPGTTVAKSTGSKKSWKPSVMGESVSGRHASERSKSGWLSVRSTSVRSRVRIVSCVVWTPCALTRPSTRVSRKVSR